MHPISRSVVVLSLLGLPLLGAQAAIGADAGSAPTSPRRFGLAAPEAGESKSLLVADRRADRTSAALSLQAANPALQLESDSVRLTLDAFGSFGSSTSGEDAIFDDGNLEAGTVFEYMVHARGLGFLDGDSLLLPQSFVRVERDGDAVRSTYELGAFRFEVRSELLDCDRPNCAWLVQDWTVTNLSSEDARLELSPYLDGDLFFSGDFGNDYGARSGTTLYQFDEGSDPSAPSSYLGLSTEVPAALRTAREVGEYSELRRRIKQGGLLIDRLARADRSSADLDGDDVTDTGFDVSIAASHDFGQLAPGAVAHLTVRIQWGIGALDELNDLVADAGPDQLLECEGREGTLVVLDSAASAPAAQLVAHRWLLEGVLAAEGSRAELLLMPGEHRLVLEVEDGSGRVASDELFVRIEDSTKPHVEVGAPLVLWPPNHRMVEISPPVRIVDACTELSSLHLIGLFVDEDADVKAGGDGHTGADVELTADGRLFLRAERQGGGDGRVYKVLCRAMDDSGNGTVFAFEVHVPHSPGTPVVSSGVAAVVRFP